MKKTLLILALASFAVFSGIQAEEMMTINADKISYESLIDVDDLTINHVDYHRSSFEILAHLPHLSRLNLIAKNLHAITTTQVEELADIVTLKDLTISKYSQQGGNTIDFSSYRHHPSLERLSFSQDFSPPSGYTGLGVPPRPPRYFMSQRDYIREDLAKIPQLKNLRIDYFSAKEGWNAFESLENLEILILKQPDVSGKTSDQLQEMVLPKLKKLVINGYRALEPYKRLPDPDFRGVDVTQLAPTLEHLDLAATNFSDEEVALLTSSDTLQVINLSDTDVTIEVLFPLANISTLREIKLNNLDMRGADYSVLADLPKLEVLSVKNTMDEADIQTLGTLKQLKELYINKSVDKALLEQLLPHTEINYSTL